MTINTSLNLNRTKTDLNNAKFGLTFGNVLQDR